MDAATIETMVMMFLGKLEIDKLKEKASRVRKVYKSVLGVDLPEPMCLIAYELVKEIAETGHITELRARELKALAEKIYEIK